MTRHPLLGKLLRWDDESGDQYTVSRFTVDLGNGFFLAVRLCPRHGTDLDVSHIVSIESLAEREGAEIFDDWETLAEPMECSHEDTDEPEAEPGARALH